MKVLMTTLNSKFIHSSMAVKYLYAAMKKDFETASNILVEKQEFTINNTQDYIFNEILAGKYHIVCFSCYIWNIQKTLHLCKLLKKAKPEMKIILGGPEVSYTMEHLVDEYYVDYILCGEGEKTLPQLIRKIESTGKSDACLEKVIYSKPITPEEMIFPYKDVEANKILYYESSRGCPYRCSYCMSSIDKSLRVLPLDRVFREMDFFISRNVKQVKFIDRTFNFDKKRSCDIFQYLIEHDNGVTNFHFEICAQNLDDETIQLISKARKGLFQFEIGIQSTNEKTLKAVDRGMNMKRIMEKTKKLIDLGNSHIHVDLIAGLPYENLDSFANSFNDVYGLEADALQLGFLKLLKGTKIRAEEEKHGYVYDDEAPYQIICNKYISAEDIAFLKRVESLLDDFWNKGGFKRAISFGVKDFYDNTQDQMNMVCFQQEATRFSGAFAFYAGFSNFYYRKGYHKMSHRKEDNYRILNEFFMEIYGEKSIKYQYAQELLYEDLVERMNPDAVKKFNKKGWSL